MILNTKKMRWLAVLIIAGVPFGNCYYDKEELLYPGNNQQPNCITSPATFNADILPLMISKCAFSGCHDESGAGGYVFQNYDQISAAKNAINTQAIVHKTMPPRGPLPAVEIEMLKCWIEGGALNN